MVSAKSVCATQEIHSEVFSGLHHCEHLFLVGAITPFCLRESSAIEGDWKFSIRNGAKLQKHSSDRYAARVCLKYEWQLGIRDLDHVFRRQRALELLESAI